MSTLVVLNALGITVVIAIGVGVLDLFRCAEPTLRCRGN